MPQEILTNKKAENTYHNISNNNHHQIINQKNNQENNALKTKLNNNNNISEREIILNEQKEKMESLNENNEQSPKVADEGENYEDEQVEKSYEDIDGEGEPDQQGEEYEGFRIAAKGEPNEGKLVEETAGGIVRPLDISITKNVFGLMVNSLVVVLLVLLGARWYRRHDAVEEAPHGFAGIVEMLVTMIEDDIIKVCVGPDYKRYSPYLLTAFFFIFINNLMGIIPIFPGGANITGNIAVTFTLAICTFLAVNLFGNKHYYKDIFWPDVPVFLKAIPLMPLIEIIGVFTKPFSLMIRLFANILAGHMMLLGVVAVVFLTAKMGIGLNAGMSFIAVCFGVFMDILELLVAFLQAYVFTMLSSVFIGLSRQAPEKE